MSWYYTYYIGHKKADGKIHLLGPYNADGKLRPALERSRSYASELYKDFYIPKEDELSDQVKQKFKGYIEDRLLSVLSYKDLGSTDFIKTGYFLIDSVNRYLQTKGDLDKYEVEGLFYDSLTPEAYAGKMVAEVNKTDIPKVKYDWDGEETEFHPYTDYMYFAYPDYDCIEYETFLLKNACQMMEYYGAGDVITVDDMYIILTQG